MRLSAAIFTALLATTAGARAEPRLPIEVVRALILSAIGPASTDRRMDAAERAFMTEDLCRVACRNGNNALTYTQDTTDAVIDTVEMHAKSVSVTFLVTGSGTHYTHEQKLLPIIAAAPIYRDDASLLDNQSKSGKILFGRAASMLDRLNAKSKIDAPLDRLKPKSLTSTLAGSEVLPAEGASKLQEGSEAANRARITAMLSSEAPRRTASTLQQFAAADKSEHNKAPSASLERKEPDTQIRDWALSIRNNLIKILALINDKLADASFESQLISISFLVRAGGIIDNIEIENNRLSASKRALVAKAVDLLSPLPSPPDRKAHPMTVPYRIARLPAASPNVIRDQDILDEVLTADIKKCWALSKTVESGSYFPEFSVEVNADGSFYSTPALLNKPTDQTDSSARLAASALASLMQCEPLMLPSSLTKGLRFPYKRVIRFDPRKG